MAAVFVAAGVGLVYWANRARTDHSAIVGLYMLFGFPGVLLSVAGLAGLVNGWAWGALVLGLGLALALPLIKQFRVALSSLTPLDPASPIDMTGLAILLAVIVISAYSLRGADPTSTGSVGVGTLIVNLITFVALAVVAVGYRIHRSGREVVQRLGLVRPSGKAVAIGLASVIACFILSIIGSLLTRYFQPDLFDSLQKSIPDLTSGIRNPLGAALLGLTAGIGEEVLFRGAIQPRFGIVFTAVLFALLHSQYGWTWVIVGLFGIGILLGIERKYFGTTTSIITHAVYNFLVVLLQTL